MWSFNETEKKIKENSAQLAEKAEKTYVDTKIGNMGNTKTFKGSCLFSALPTSGAKVDDYWYVIDKTSNYCWNGTSWIDIGNNLNIGDNTITLEKTNLPYQSIYKNLAYFQLAEYLTAVVENNKNSTINCNLSPYIQMSAGKYLIYLDLRLEVTNLPNGRIVPNIFVGSSNVMVDVSDQKALAPRLPFKDNNRIIAYGIANLTTDVNARIGCVVTEQNTSVNNTFTIKVNKVYAVKIDSINEELINSLDYYNLNKYIPVINSSEIDRLNNEVDKLKDEFGELNKEEIVCFGDSMTGSQSGWVNELATTYKLNIINRGIGGQTAGQIGCRQGGVELLCDPFTIPTDNTTQTPVTCNYKLYAQQSAFEGINPCYIKGIKGILRNSTNTINGFTFQRSESGSEVVINRPTPIVTDNMINKRKQPMIIWVGTNGDYTDTSREASKLIEIIDSMISFAECEKYIVIGLTTDVNYGIPAINEKLKSRYGRRFLDLRSYLIKYGLSDMGISPTSSDNDRIANNNVPTSLLSDDTHLTADCQKKVVAKLVYEKLQDLFIIF